MVTPNANLQPGNKTLRMNTDHQDNLGEEMAKLGIVKNMLGTDLNQSREFDVSKQININGQ